jgi:hypothetical protein
MFFPLEQQAELFPDPEVRRNSVSRRWRYAPNQFLPAIYADSGVSFELLVFLTHKDSRTRMN